MFYTDNPLADFHRYDAMKQAELEQLPKCSYCEKPIQDEYCYVINDEPVCEECLEYHFRKRVEDICL